MLLEERAPFVIEERAVGLQIVFDSLVGLLVFLLQLDDLAEKVQSQEGWFTALPGKDHFAAVLPLDVLADMSLEDFVGNAELAGTVEEILLVEIIAVGAVQIADGSDGLDHRVIGRVRTSGSGPSRKRRRWRLVLGHDRLAHGCGR